MTLPPNLNVYISAALFVIGAYLFALYLGLIVWAFRDIRSRSRDLLAQIMVTLLVAVLNVPGLLVYLLLRPHGTLAEDYVHLRCVGCGRLLNPGWDVCPYCGLVPEWQAGSDSDGKGAAKELAEPEPQVPDQAAPGLFDQVSEVLETTEPLKEDDHENSP